MNAPDKKWELSSAAFDKLLASLNPDRDRAAERYEIIRQKLIFFFENRGCVIAEDLADETMNRVARKLDEGAVIYATKPHSYFYAVARNTLSEYRDRPRSMELSLNHEPGDDPEQREAIANDKEQEGLRLDCQKECVEALPDEVRMWLVEYYREEPGIKMKKKRSELAARLTMTPNALRIKACRVRDALDECVLKCLDHISERMK